MGTKVENTQLRWKSTSNLEELAPKCAKYKDIMRLSWHKLWKNGTKLPEPELRSEIPTKLAKVVLRSEFWTKVGNLAVRTEFWNKLPNLPLRTKIPTKHGILEPSRQKRN